MPTNRVLVVVRLLPERFAARVSAVVAALLLLLFLPSLATAQLGALARKAASKVAGQAVGVNGAGGAAPRFDDTVLELDEGRLTAVIAGLQASAAVTAPGGATRATLMQRAGAANEQRNALLEGHEKDLQRHDEEIRRVNMCTQEVLDSLSDAHNAAAAKKAAALAASGNPMDSPVMKELMQVTMEMQKRAAAGDTAGAMQLQQALARKHGFDPAQDSLTAKRRCGSLPAKAAWHRQADSLLVVANTSLQQAQALDGQAAAAGAKTAGMTAQQFAMARERVQAYVGANGNPSSSWRYSPAERKALQPKLQQLKALL